MANPIQYFIDCLSTTIYKFLGVMYWWIYNYVGCIYVYMYGKSLFRVLGYIILVLIIINSVILWYKQVVRKSWWNHRNDTTPVIIPKILGHDTMSIKFWWYVWFKIETMHIKFLMIHMVSILNFFYTLY